MSVGVGRRWASGGAGAEVLLVVMVVLYFEGVIGIIIVSELAFRNAPVECSRKSMWTEIIGGEK